MHWRLWSTWQKLEASWEWLPASRRRSSFFDSKSPSFRLHLSTLVELARRRGVLRVGSLARSAFVDGELRLDLDRYVTCKRSRNRTGLLDLLGELEEVALVD